MLSSAATEAVAVLAGSLPLAAVADAVGPLVVIVSEVLLLVVARGALVFLPVIPAVTSLLAPASGCEIVLKVFCESC